MLASCAPAGVRNASVVNGTGLEPAGEGTEKPRFRSYRADYYFIIGYEAELQGQWATA